MPASALLIDDNPDDLSPLLANLRMQKLSVAARHPQEVTVEDLNSVDLVLVDLRLEDWPERDRAESIALSPLNGMGLAEVLRGHIETGESARPIAFALHTGHPEDLSPSLPADKRLHTLARTHNLEWVFAKSGQSGPAPREIQIASLARGVAMLPRYWDPTDPSRNEAQAVAVLGLKQEDRWFLAAWEDVHRCRAPLHELSSESHGLALVRWLLQRILPYPCFLWDNTDLAVRIGVTPGSLAHAMSHGTLSRRFAGVLYSGILQDFSGPRWWRSGVEHLLWELTEGQSFDPDVVRAAVLKGVESEVEALPTVNMVVCIGDDLNSRDSIAPVNQCVRVQPDDWPSFADQAWARSEQVRESKSIAAVVIQEDYERLQVLLHEA